MNIQPAPNRVLVEQFKEDSIQGKIIIPETNRKMENKGKVVKLGKVTKDKPQIWEVGEIVHFHANATTIPVEVMDGEEKKHYKVMNQHDIWASEIVDLS